MTWKRRDLDRGLEPDECYYVQHEPQLRGKEEIDLTVDPPPDLALEIEITHSVLDRMSVYAALGVPEVWRFDGKVLRIHVLEPPGRYRQRDRSPSLPLLPPAEVVRFLAARNEIGETSWVRSFRAWVRENVVAKRADS